MLAVLDAFQELFRGVFRANGYSSEPTCSLAKMRIGRLRTDKTNTGEALIVLQSIVRHLEGARLERIVQAWALIASRIA